MFNKQIWSRHHGTGLSAVWEPLHVLIPAAPGWVLPCRHHVLVLLCSSPPKATAPLTDSLCLTGFPSFNNVCGKYDILSKEKLACRCWQAVPQGAASRQPGSCCPVSWLPALQQGAGSPDLPRSKLPLFLPKLWFKWVFFRLFWITGTLHQCVLALLFPQSAGSASPK